ncbi:hypothetical protein Pan241w_58260 [Gimesia alba]|uniref:Uncharacterized protein n=1 Tax=Gimesia alba TaxID=2527973 RepID=A0A517RPA4_9PLAN|nr:hypothetical protein Pan241w_58260 [Gimesia alba]
MKQRLNIELILHTLKLQRETISHPKEMIDMT